jgi:hypothetical protein
MEEATREPGSLLLTERHQRGAVYLADQQRKVVDNNGKTTYLVNITNQEPGGGFHPFKTEVCPDQDNHRYRLPRQAGRRRQRPHACLQAGNAEAQVPFPQGQKLRKVGVEDEMAKRTGAARFLRLLI